MKFENTEVFNFEGAFRGLRNPLESWNKSDSYDCIDVDDCKYCVMSKEECVRPKLTDFIIGKEDMKLAQRMILASASERKFMRQIFVSVDITAPLFFFKEYDTYKVGTVANSTSTIHKLATTPITLNRFETDDYSPEIITSIEEIGYLIQFLETLRVKYLETKDKRYWKELIRWLPESWLQTRTCTMNYENLRTMYFDRRYHKLNEWSGRDDSSKPNFITWIESLPYAKELITYTGNTGKEEKL